MSEEHVGREHRARSVLVAGATRGLGLAVTREFLDHGWQVVATARCERAPELEALVDAHPGMARIERLDITDEADIRRVHDATEPGSLDVLYINAGVAGDDVRVGQVDAQEFTRVMVTNALAPMRVVEQLGPLVTEGGMIAVVSSRQGSISFNTSGGHEVYRASKAALNQLMRSYAARVERPQRTLLLLHPGWVRTSLGGDGAQLTPEESARGLVGVVERNLGAPGLQFLDYTGQAVPW